MKLYCHTTMRSWRRNDCDLASRGKINLHNKNLAPIFKSGSWYEVKTKAKDYYVLEDEEGSSWKWYRGNADPNTNHYIKYFMRKSMNIEYIRNTQLKSVLL